MIVDDKYVRFLSSRLEKFSQKKDNLYNFRCPYCGDSSKSRIKARGYFFLKKGGYIFKCHNCGVGRSLGNFLKDNASDLYDEYLIERYRNGLTGKGTNAPSPKIPKSKPKFTKKIGSSLTKISELNNEHPAQGYLLGREIPQEHWDKLYYTDKFKRWVNEQQHTYDGLQNDRGRIIIPLIDPDGVWFGIQGRSLETNPKLRYITHIFDEDKPKIFGWDRVNESRTIYITEGPFDSLFIENGIAMCGADVDLSNYLWDVVYIFDNEPRNSQIVKRIGNAIDRGDSVVIWPDHIQEKDLNDMHLAGINPQNVVESNVYSGLEARLKFNSWKKV